jgi:hypothetical protein
VIQTKIPKVLWNKDHKTWDVMKFTHHKIIGHFEFCRIRLQIYYIYIYLSKKRRYHIHSQGLEIFTLIGGKKKNYSPLPLWTKVGLKCPPYVPKNTHHCHCDGLRLKYSSKCILNNPPLLLFEKSSIFFLKKINLQTITQHEKMIQKY